MSFRPSATAAVAIIAALVVQLGATTPAHANVNLGFGPTTGGTVVEIDRPTGLTFTRVIDSEHTVFGIERSGSLYGWAQNDFGQLGDGTVTERLIPARVGGSLSGRLVVDVIPTPFSTYAIDSAGAVHAWGLNGSGQLGDGTQLNRRAPIEVAGTLAGENVTTVVTGEANVFAITSDGDVFAWGDNRYGQLGDGTTQARFEPSQVALDPEWGAVLDLAVMQGRAIAITDEGWVIGWGINTYGLLGDGTTTNQPTPQPILQLPNGSGPIQLDVRLQQSYALAPNGKVFSWGENPNGELGHGTTASSLLPVAVEIPDATAIARLDLPYALGADGSVFSWGTNSYGQIGDGSQTTRLAPVRVTGFPDGTAIEQISAGPGGDFALARDAQGRVFSWGRNGDGQLGHGTTSTVSSPLQITGSPQMPAVADVAAVAAGSYALTTSGAMYSWGSNALGRIGQGFTSGTTRPRLMTQVTSDSASFTSTNSRGYALTTAGRLWGWGVSLVGDGENLGERVPAPVDGVALADVRFDSVAGTQLKALGTKVLVTSPPGVVGFAPVVVNYRLVGEAQPAVAAGRFEYGAVPTAQTQPVDVTLEVSSSTTMIAAARSIDRPTACWQQYSFTSLSWRDCTVQGTTTSASGVTTARLPIESYTKTGLQRWRAIFTNRFGQLVTSSATVTIVAGAWQRTPPSTISGSGIVGEEIWAFEPSWVPEADSFRHEWKRDGIVVGTGNPYIPGTADVGRRITVETIGMKSGFPDRRVSGPSIIVAPRGIVSRLAGADRYATSAAITKASYPDPGNFVFIANGTDFPDALSGAAAAGADRYGSPVLLVPRTGLPAAVKSELLRLKPSALYVLGGTGAVSTAMEAELARYARVVRLSGSDRYQTSAFISAWSYDRGVSVAYVANGADFPDALSGAAAAGFREGPILLTARNSLSTSVESELQRLRPKRIFVLGGTGVVSSAVQSQLRQYTSGTVSRLSGSDRYATSAAISAATFSPNVPVAYIANGTTFPDALSGAAVAGKLGGPVLLTPRNGLPESIKRELQRLNPGRIIILGGTGAVSTTVANQLKNL